MASSFLSPTSAANVLPLVTGASVASSLAGTPTASAGKDISRRYIYIYTSYSVHLVITTNEQTFGQRAIACTADA